jgi:hypothetical protein
MARAKGAGMSEPSIKELQGERNRLWAEARLKGLPVGSAQRDRIAALDVLIRERKAATAIPSKRPKKLPAPDAAAPSATDESSPEPNA